MQLKGGDGGQITANMLQFNPTFNTYLVFSRNLKV